MSQYYFYLSLDGIGENRIDDSLIANILKVPVKNGNIECPNDLPATNDVVFYHELKWLLDLIEPHKKELIAAGISFGNSSIWMIYGYFNQCNMEFDAPILKRIGDLSLKMCVSCYEDEQLENRESFNSELIRNPQKGIWVSTTTGIDNKIGNEFQISIKIDNERLDSSFIFTSLDINNEFINNFELVKLIPEPKSVQYGEDCNIFYYDKIVQNRSSEKISLILKAKSAGIFRGQIRVCEGGQYIEDSLIAVIE